jgi:GNAT superfamily N-acetyltransferase
MSTSLAEQTDVNGGITIRAATPSDLDVILHHRKQMFIDMGHGDDEKMEASERTSREFFAQALAEGRYKGWLAQQSDGRIISGGGIVISTRPSHPAHPSLRRADILNMYTEPPFRRRGIARQLMLAMIAWCRQEGFEWVTLHASNDGRKLYESLGFKQTSEMRLELR